LRLLDSGEKPRYSYSSGWANRDRETGNAEKNELEAAKRNLYDVFMIEQKADIFTAIRDIVSARPGIEMDPSI